MKTILLVDRNYSKHSKSGFLERTIQSLVANKTDYELYVDEHDFTSLFDLKIKRFREVLSKYSEDQIIMLIDAFDTYVVASDQEIEEKFLMSEADVIYSVEKNCYPNPKLSSFFETGKFLNSGGVIFRNGKFQKLLDLIITIVEYSRAGGQTTCDQYLHSTIVAAALLQTRIKLDTDSTIFQSLFLEDLDNFNLNEGRYMNEISNSRPCVFHGNGDDGFTKLNDLFDSTGLNSLN